MVAEGLRNRTRRKLAQWRRRARALLLEARGEARPLFLFWTIALGIGIAAGVAAVLFRRAIAALQTLLYGTDDLMLASVASLLPWWMVLAIPVIGGLVVGIILQVFTRDGRPHAVAEVIEAAALREGRMNQRAGWASALASLITLSSGGSTGREGPVVHIAALISSWVTARLRNSGIEARDLLGCAVAAAVAASFNAPIAGAIFALEVVLRHFALHAFAPITIAAVAGTVVSRLSHGDIPEFSYADQSPLAFYQELPAFLILGLLSGLVAAAMMRAIFLAEDTGNRLQARLRLPIFLRPALAGVLLGALAIWFPHIIGVGYETTSAALAGDFLFWNIIVLVAVKIAAVAITLGGRMGGGVFSPSLMVGALLGLAFGQVATGLAPQVSGSETIYALAGMGAVTAAVLGAPISTTLIVFEMTGNWQAAIAVMVAVSLSTLLASRLVHRSFFLTQLERRGVHVAAGPQQYLLATVGVSELMRAVEHIDPVEEAAARVLIEEGAYLRDGDTLETAMTLFEESGAEILPVIAFGSERVEPRLLGIVRQVAALRAFNRALADTAREEHS